MKKLSLITESVWGDLHSRGIGELEREEDNVDLLDGEGLYQYLKEHYRMITERTEHEMSIEKDNGNLEKRKISVPILKKFYSVSLLLVYKYIKKEIFFSRDLKEHYNDLYKKLSDTFDVVEKPAYIGGTCTISDKNGNVSNKVFIEILDFIIDNANTEKLLVEKI